MVIRQHSVNAERTYTYDDSEYTDKELETINTEDFSVE